jgi:hypothetical protein
MEFPKPWPEQYLREAIADEIELAAVHPKFHSRVSMPSSISMETMLTPDPPKFGTAGWRNARTTPTFALPRWRRTWAAAGPLIAELSLRPWPDDEEGTVSVGYGGGRRNVTESYKDHPSKDAAVMAALVRAAIQACTEARENN